MTAAVCRAACRRPPLRSARKQSSAIAATGMRPRRRRCPQCFSISVVVPAMDVIREAETVPEEAVSCAVSLDGVPLRPDGEEEACWRGASGGVPAKRRAEKNGATQTPRVESVRIVYYESPLGDGAKT